MLTPTDLFGLGKETLAVALGACLVYALVTSGRNRRRRNKTFWWLLGKQGVGLLESSGNAVREESRRAHRDAFPPGFHRPCAAPAAQRSVINKMPSFTSGPADFLENDNTSTNRIIVLA